MTRRLVSISMLAVVLVAGCGGLRAQWAREEAERKACDAGDGFACLAAGRHENNGESWDHTFADLARACELGVAEGCTEAMALDRGSEAAEQAVQRHGCLLGLDDLCLELNWNVDAELVALACRRTPARCVEVLERIEWASARGPLDEREGERARYAVIADELARIGCNVGSETCSTLAGFSCLSTDTRLELHARACTNGAPSSCWQQAELLTEDDPRRRSLYERGCRGDDPKACAALGRLIATDGES